MLNTFALQFLYVIGNNCAVIACVKGSTKIGKIQVERNYRLLQVPSVARQS